MLNYFRALNFTLYLGGITLSPVDSSTLTVASDRAIVHEGYSSNTLNNDIALVRLPDPILYTSK